MFKLLALESAISYCRSSEWLKEAARGLASLAILAIWAAAIIFFVFCDALESALVISIIAVSIAAALLLRKLL